MSGASKKSSPASGEPENPVVYVERLRKQAETFQRIVEEEIRMTRTLIEKRRVSQAKRRRDGRRMD
jgi:hypothetical protein